MTVHCVSSDCHLPSFMNHILNNNLRRSPHFGKCPFEDLHVPAWGSWPFLFHCFNTRKSSLTQHGWAALFGYAKAPEGKEGEKGKEKREKSGKSGSEKYLLLTNQVWGPYRKLRTEFFPLQFMAQARSARAINRRSVTYILRTEKPRLVRCLLYLYCVSDGFGNDFHPWGTASNFWTRPKAKRVNLKSYVFKSLARFSTRLRVKESFKLLFAS